MTILTGFTQDIRDNTLAKITHHGADEGHCKLAHGEADEHGRQDEQRRQEYRQRAQAACAPPWRIGQQGGAAVAQVAGVLAGVALDGAVRGVRWRVQAASAVLEPAQSEHEHASCLSRRLRHLSMAKLSSLHARLHARAQ